MSAPDWADPVAGKIEAAPAATPDWADPVAGKLPSKYAQFMKGQLEDKPLKRWDIVGDIRRAAKSSMEAMGSDAKAAFPGPRMLYEQSQQNRKDYGLIAGSAKDQLDQAKRGVSALKVPLDALGVITSPVTGLIHGTAGSALSYITPTKPGEDPKAAADAGIDSAMIGLGPRGMVGGPAAVESSANILKAMTKERAAAKLTNRAIDKINARAASDKLTAQEVIDKQAAGRETGDAVTLMDLGKRNLKGLAGSVYRAAGDAGAHIDDFLKARIANAKPGLKGGIEDIAKGSSYETINDLYTARSKAAKPLFDDAFATGSTAPLENQYESHFNEADKSVQGAANKVQEARAKLTRTEAKSATNSNVYSTPTPKARQFVKDQVTDAEATLEAAKASREEIRAKLQRAQADGTAKAPGAIWSPRLQEFLSNPEIQSGLKKALKLEKQDAVTERRPFKDSDYGIVGTDAAGDPILGEVPTMKALAVAKEGLDARIAEMVDPVTRRPTKAGLSLKRFRDGFLSELDTLNPKYAKARQAWSGPSQSAEAVQAGREHFSRTETDAQVAAEFKKLPDGDKEFYRLGAAEAKLDAMTNSPMASDKSKRVINSDKDINRFRMLFDSDADAQKFIDSVERKRTAFETNQKITGGSQTQERAQDDGSERASAMLNVGHGVTHGLSGNMLAMASSLLRAKKDLGLISSPELNKEMARILTDPNLNVNQSPGMRLLNSVPLPATQGYLARGAVNALRLPPFTAQSQPPSSQ